MDNTTKEYAKNPTNLDLYMFDSCPYCRRVMRWIDANWAGSPQIVMRDIMTDMDARKTLECRGGSTQVPCLFVDGVPMYESLDIIAYLESVNK